MNKDSNILKPNGGEEHVSEPFRVWQSGEWTILHVRAGGTETTSSLTRNQARSLSWKLRNSPRQTPEIPHWNGIGKYSPCISFDAGSLTVNGGGFGDSDGGGCFVFRDDELDFEQEDGPLYRWINIGNSDLLHLRDKLNELFPLALESQLSRLSELRGALETCANVFRRYAELHRAKGTTEGNLKAGNNNDLADFCEGVLADTLPSEALLRSGGLR